MSVSYVLDGTVAVITIDDGKANALSHEVIDAIHRALDSAEEQKATAVLIVGREGRFSAGFDLSVMTAGDEQMRALVVAGAELLARILVFPMPVVAACTGHALAAGALLLMVSDHRVAADGPFKIGLNEVAIGMGLPQFAIDIASYRMPPSKLDSALLGEVFDPSGAVGAGYVDRVLDPGTVIAEAMATAKRLAQLRSGAVAISKDKARGPMARRIVETVAADMASMGGPAPAG